MTIEQLKDTQAKELRDYWTARAVRSKELEDNQQEIVENTFSITSKSAVILKNLLMDQRQRWEENERQELDMIKQYHAQQMESLGKKQSNRQTVTDRIRWTFINTTDRGGR